ncbi:dihydroxyacetone kinase subunit DhaL [Tropicimonas sp.]|uniref:dihydroxyacetone kinase subunit DhaL n=1 Tax=Tropicimonas sp. TaxID=2067044 RepID=UPI003A8C3364
MNRTKKLMNTSEAIVDEMIDGLLGAHPGILEPAGSTGRVVRAVNGPRLGKVGIVVGGGSGHEPAFCGYVGRGLADAAAIGNVFASPSPEPIVEATRAVNGGAGVLYLYGNYTGDTMNFDMAADEAISAGIDVRSVRVTDDVTSAPAECRSQRRGIAGDFFVFKVAGAAADRMAALDEVERLARKANASTATMGVALSSCSLPQTRKPNFDLGHDEMEIGMGLHGEPGIRRARVESADEVTDILLEHVLGELHLTAGDRVGVLVNSLGSTTLMELYLLHRRTRQILGDLGVSIHCSYVGEYATSLEMAGASISLIRLDDELAALLDHPCHSVTLKVGAPPAPVSVADRLAPVAAPAPPVAARSVTRHDGTHRPGGEITPDIFANMIVAASFAVEDHADWLSELDGVVGDGDHGVTMGLGWRAVRRAMAERMPDDDIEAICARIATTFLNAVGASTGPLYASAFLAAGVSAAGRDGLDAAALVAFFEAAARGIEQRGGAVRGDKTMLDACWPGIDAARLALDEGADVAGCLRAAARGALHGMKATANIAARKGRTARLGERSFGHIDPGSASSYLMIEAFRRSFEEQTRDRAEPALRRG